MSLGVQSFDDEVLRSANGPDRVRWKTIEMLRERYRDGPWLITDFRVDAKTARVVGAGDRGRRITCRCMIYRWRRGRRFIAGTGKCERG